MLFTIRQPGLWTPPLFGCWQLTSTYIFLANEEFPKTKKSNYPFLHTKNVILLLDSKILLGTAIYLLKLKLFANQAKAITVHFFTWGGAVYVT